MRLALRVAVVLSASAVVGAQTPQPPQPTTSPQVFRAGIDLVTMDVTALDGNGRQVTDLGTADFVVEIDGSARQVTSAEYVRLVDPLRAIGGPRPVAPAVDTTFYSTNAKDAPRGRLIVLLIDQGNIRTGSARTSMQSAKKFVDTLTPDDRVAVIALPGPGEFVDFTTDHDKVRESLLRITGMAAAPQTRFNLSVTESMALYLHNNAQVAADAIERECEQAGSAADLDRCEREVEQDAAEIIGEIRHRTETSLRAMRQLLASLAAVEGPKSVLLISEGLILDGLNGDVDDIATVAADARASLDVLLLDVPQFEASQIRRPTTPREDRDLQVTGLESMAGAARGMLYRVNANADFAFERISRALDGYYLLGVESKADDRNGKRHKITVKSVRRGVSVRSRRTFLTSVSAKAMAPGEAVSRALQSPLPIGDLPLRLSTWTYKEPGSPRIRVIVTAEAERLVDQSLDYTAGLALVNRDGRGVSPNVGPRTLTVKEGDQGTAVYTGAMMVDPGVYRLRLALADSDGRVGSVERTITAWQMDGPSVTVGDLLLAGVATINRDTFSPAIEPVVSSGRMAAFVEVYGSTPAQLTGVEAVLDVLRDEQSPPLSSTPMQVRQGQSPEIASVEASVATMALPPGRYLARSTIRQGGKPIGHLIRPFRVTAAAPSATDGAVAAAGGLPPDMASVLSGSLPAFDRKELLAPALLTPIFAAAEARGAAAKAALQEARAGQLGTAAMTALGDGDQLLAAFLKGLDLLGQSQADRAAVQLQTAMQMAPAFAPARLYLGAALAEANRHKEAAGLLQSSLSAAPASSALARVAAEEWIKAGQPSLAIAPLEQALTLPDADARARKLLGVAYALSGRAGDAVPLLAPYLDGHPSDQAALLAALYGTYTRHQAAPQRETLAADRDRAAKWARAYSASGGPLQPLVGAWMKYLVDLKP